MMIWTPRLTLRPFNEGDIDAMSAFLNDWEVAQWLAIPPFPYRRADARFYVDHVRANHETGPATEFAIALTEGDGVVGAVGLRRNSGGPDGDPADAAIGYWLGQPHWGHGYAAEAVRAVVAYGFGSLGLERLEAETDPENERSARVLAKVGFRPIGQASAKEARSCSVPTRRGSLLVNVHELLRSQFNS
jgi:[ribosomal protein S5]-alanine N-acetyltransferase